MYHSFDIHLRNSYSVRFTQHKTYKRIWCFDGKKNFKHFTIGIRKEKCSMEKMSCKHCSKWIDLITARFFQPIQMNEMKWSFEKKMVHVCINMENAMREECYVVSVNSYSVNPRKKRKRKKDLKWINFVSDTLFLRMFANVFSSGN